MTEMSREETSALFVLLVKGRKAKNRLFGIRNGFLEEEVPGSELKELEMDSRNADSAKNRLIESFMGDQGLLNMTVNSILPPKRFFGPKYDDIREELFAEACLLLDRALGIYDPECSSFNTFFTSFSSGALRDKCAKLTNPTWTRGDTEETQLVVTLTEPSKIEELPIASKGADSDPLMGILVKYRVIVNGCLNERSPILIEAGLNAREKMVLETVIHGNWGARTLNIQQISYACGMSRASCMENAKKATDKLRNVMLKYREQGL